MNYHRHELFGVCEICNDLWYGKPVSVTNEKSPKCASHITSKCFDTFNETIHRTIQTEEIVTTLEAMWEVDQAIAVKLVLQLGNHASPMLSTNLETNFHTCLSWLYVNQFQTLVKHLDGLHWNELLWLVKSTLNSARDSSPCPYTSPGWTKPSSIKGNSFGSKAAYGSIGQPLPISIGTKYLYTSQNYRYLSESELVILQQERISPREVEAIQSPLSSVGTSEPGASNEGVGGSENYQLTASVPIPMNRKWKHSLAQMSPPQAAPASRPFSSPVSLRDTTTEEIHVQLDEDEHRRVEPDLDLQEEPQMKRSKEAKEALDANVHEEAKARRRARKEQLSKHISRTIENDEKFAVLYKAVVRIFVNGLKQDLALLDSKEKMGTLSLAGKFALNINGADDIATGLGRNIARSIQFSRRLQKVGESDVNYDREAYKIYKADYLRPLRQAIDMRLTTETIDSGARSVNSMQCIKAHFEKAVYTEIPAGSKSQDIEYNKK